MASAKKSISGEGSILVNEDELFTMLSQQLPPGYFYTFERAVVDEDGNLTARYHYSNSGKPPKP
jgi:hypothetical protein